MRPVGMQRRQVVEADLLAELVGVLEVDRLDAKQGEVALVFLGRPDLAGDDGAGLEAEAADLAGGDVDVVRAREVVVVGAAEEAEAVGEDFEGPLAVHQAVLLDPLLEDLEDQVLLLQAGVLGDALLLGGGDELRHGHLLQLGQVDLAAFDVLVAVVDLGVAEDVLVVLDIGDVVRKAEPGIVQGGMSVVVDAVDAGIRVLRGLDAAGEGAAVEIRVVVDVAIGGWLAGGGVGLAMGAVADHPIAEGRAGLAVGPGAGERAGLAVAGPEVERSAPRRCCRRGRGGWSRWRRRRSRARRTGRGNRRLGSCGSEKCPGAPGEGGVH